MDKFVFNEGGDLQPVGLICCSQRKFKSFFIDGLNHPNRNALWENYKIFIACLKEKIFEYHFVVWMFGSYVTNANPGDIDIAIWVNKEDKLQLNNKDVVELVYSIAKETFGIHLQYILEKPENNQLLRNAPDDLKDWLTGRNNNRGFIQLDYKKHKQ